MTFNILYGTLQKARNSSRILFHSSASTTCVPEGLSRGRYELLHVPHICYVKSQTTIGQRPHSAFSSKERRFHTLVSKNFCSRKKENIGSDKNEDNTLRKNEQGSTQNNQVEVNKSKPNLHKKRSFYKIRHQNLVWDGSNKKNRQNKYRTYTPGIEKKIELAENKLNDTHNLFAKNSELKSDNENFNTEVLKAQDASEKNILTIDIFSDSGITHSPQFKTMPEENINGSSKINTKTTSAIDNSDKLISLKEVAGNYRNSWKKENNNNPITKSKIKDGKKSYLTVLNQNKVPTNDIVLKTKYEPLDQIKNITEEDNSISYHIKDCCMSISDKKSNNNLAFKVSKNSLQNKNSKETTEEENLKSLYSNRSKSSILENKDSLENRKHIRPVEGGRTVWNVKYRQKRSQMITNDLQYHINLKNKIQNTYKNTDLNRRYKFVHSINSILRPIKPKVSTPNKIYNNQISPKCASVLTVPSSNNSIPNDDLKTTHLSNYLLDNELYCKSTNIDLPCLSELLKNSKNHYSLINVSRGKPQNKIQLMKGINSANSDKKAMVNDLKTEIKSWKKYEYLKKVILDSTSEIYQSITNGRKFGKIRNTIYTPRKTRQKKYNCNVISIPLSEKAHINKYKKTTLTKPNTLNDKTTFSSNPDPIKTLNIKYKKNYLSTFNDLLKKNEMLVFQEKFKKNPEILEYDSQKEFLTEKKSVVMNKINKEIFIKNAKKISLENKKPWVRYLHQMNDEKKGESSAVTEISTYPSGCLKKPEFIIELMQLEGIHYEEMKKLTQQKMSGKESLNTTESSDPIESCKAIISKNEKSESIIIREPNNKFNFNKICKENKDAKVNIVKHENGKGKPISFSNLSKIKSSTGYKSKNTASGNKCTVFKMKHVNHKIHSALCNSPLDQEHSLTYESYEEIEPKVNNDSTIEIVTEVIEDDSKEPFKVNKTGKFQAKRNVNNKINSDFDNIYLNNVLNDSNKTFKLKDDQSPTNTIKVEVCSNIIYEPNENACNNQEQPEENRTGIIDKSQPKFAVSCFSTQENMPSKNNSFRLNQPEFWTANTSKEIKSKPVKPSSAIEISLNSSQPQLLDSKGPQKDCSTKATFSKAKLKNDTELSYICGNQDLEFCENSNMDECQRVNTHYNNEIFSRDLKLQHSNCDQNVGTLSKHIRNVNSIPTDLLGKSSSRKASTKQVNTPSLILPTNEKSTEKENLISGLKTPETSSDNNFNKYYQTSRKHQNIEEIENFQNCLYPFKQSNSLKVKNMNADINEFKFITFLKKCYPEISNSNKKAFIDNIKGFFRISCNYLKLDNTNIMSEDKFSIDNFLKNSHHSKDKHNINHSASNYFREISLSSKQPVSIPKINEQFCISEEYSRPDFYQKGVNQNNGDIKIKSFPSVPKQEKEATSLSGNEEFKRRYSNMFPISPKGDFQMTSNSEHLIPNEEISINDLETGTNVKNIFCKPAILKTENSLGKSNHHNSFFKKVNEKDFEKLYVNQVKKRSFCNLNHKKSYMKLRSKNKLYNQKQRFAKADLINIKNKLRGFHYNMNYKVPLGKSPHLVNIKGKRKGERTPFKLGLKPIMKNSLKHKKCHVYKLNSDVKIKLNVTEKLNLLKTVPTFQKLSDKINPESYWLNCFSKNIFTEDKLSSNEFLTYIKNRKLPTKSSLKCNN